MAELSDNLIEQIAQLIFERDAWKDAAKPGPYVPPLTWDIAREDQRQAYRETAKTGLKLMLEI